MLPVLKLPHISTLAGCMLWLAWGMPSACEAQPVCSIDLGADTTICQGSSVVLHGPAGYGNYLWSTGATSPQITVGTAGDYWCQVSYPSGERVTNGDFSAGNSGFTSQFTYSLFNLQNEGSYTVGPNASWYHPQFQGTGSGNFLIANAGYGSWANNQRRLWCQTIACCPGQTYTLSFWARTLSNDLPARVLWVMDGVLAQWPDFTLPAFGAGWQQFTTTWTAGPGQSSVNACIEVTSGDGVGDDFGIDDISISGTVVLRDTLHVSVRPLPAVDLGPDQALCNGQTADLDATVPGGTYLWQDGSTAPTFQVTGPGAYSVTVTAQNCPNTDLVNINYAPAPTVDLGPDTLLCAGSTLTLASSAAGSTVWQDGSTAATFTVSAPGLYWAEVSGVHCSARDSIQVGYKPMPAAALGNDTAVCAGTALMLDATVPGATYLWQDGSTSPTLSAAATGTYQVTVDLNGCTAQDALDLVVNPLPTVDLGPDVVRCPGAAATFDATAAGASYLWNDGSTGALLATDQPGTYSVAVEVNGCTATDTVRFSHFALQTVNLGPDRALCAGSSSPIGLHVPGATYLWSTGATTDSIAAAAAGTYWVDVTLNGCAVRDSIQLAETPLPAVALGADQNVCPGATALLDATAAGGAYLWSNGATTPTVLADTGSWFVAVTVNGCTGTDTVAVHAYSPPAVDLGPDTTLCAGETLALDAGVPGAQYAWSNGAAGQGTSFSAPGTAWVQVTDAQGCTGADSILISYALPGSIQLGADSTFCQGTTVSLDATLAGATQYLWNTGATGPLLVAAGGTYWVQATVGACMVADTIQLAEVAAPVVSLGSDTTLCPGETLLLQVAATGLALAWQDGSQGASFLVDQAGAFHVVATNAAGCTATAGIAVAYMGANAFQLGPDTAICQGRTITLDATLPGGSTQWSGASSSTAPVISVSTAGLYIATTSVGGCAFSDTIAVAVNASPVVHLGNDTTICAGSSLVLTASGGALAWDNGSTAALRTVSSAGTYWVQVTAGGCAARDSMQVAVAPLPAVALGPDTALCAPAAWPVDLTLANATFFWNDASTAAQRTLTSGTWSVQVTEEGCAASDTIQISELPAPQLQLPTDTTLCADLPWLIDVAQPGSTYLWSTGSTLPSLTVTAPGLYGVTVDRNGCTASAHTHVAVMDLSLLSLGPDTLLCPGGTLLLHMDEPGIGVLWQDGTTAAEFNVVAAGTYHALFAAGECTGLDSITVGYVPLPAPDLGSDQTLCAGDTAWLSVDPGTAALLWSTGGTAASIPVTTPGTYSAALSMDGCVERDTVLVQFVPVDDHVSLGPDRVLCPGDQMVLDAEVPAATDYLWSTGDTGPALLLSTPGLYAVRVSGPCLLAVDTVLVQDGPCTPQVHVPNAFTPDQDGFNDRFGPVLEGAVRSWSFRIYDRWGRQVFSSETPDGAWDGNQDGQEAPMGVYVWDLHYTLASGQGVVQEHLRGSVTLVR